MQIETRSRSGDKRSSSCNGRFDFVALRSHCPDALSEAWKNLEADQLSAESEARTSERNGRSVGIYPKG